MINGLVSPPLLLLIVLMSNDRRILGNRVNSLGLNILGWATTLAMSIAAVVLVALWASGA